mmetsp:Transcript_10162/g.29639  ORF Transcript_10162/g.29639 Transcript_10162/m.29639 type:complete len:244 (+) Transcript_10162:383-1114(+)
MSPAHGSARASSQKPSRGFSTGACATRSLWAALGPRPAAPASGRCSAGRRAARRVCSSTCPSSRCIQCSRCRCSSMGRCSRARSSRDHSSLRSRADSSRCSRCRCSRREVAAVGSSSRWRRRWRQGPAAVSRGSSRLRPRRCSRRIPRCSPCSRALVPGRAACCLVRAVHVPARARGRAQAHARAACRAPRASKEGVASKAEEGEEETEVVAAAAACLNSRVAWGLLGKGSSSRWASRPRACR